MASRRTSGHSTRITLHLVGPTSWTEVPAALRYDVADPYAVRIVFGDLGGHDDDGYDDTLDDDNCYDDNSYDDQDDDGITWLLSRELLQDGLQRPAGDGDVRLWPAHAAADVLYLHLRAPSGEAMFEVSRAAVAGFLRTTESLVPLGAEGSMLRLDHELETLLSNGGADPTAR